MTFQTQGRSPGWMRLAQFGLGILAIIVAGLAITFPHLAFLSLVILISVVLFFIGVGVLNVAISVLVLASPLFGAILAGIMIGFSLLIVGIQMITTGVMGR